MPKREYRVWTKNAFDSYSILNDWSTKAECKQLLKNKYGHYPSWAFISQASTIDSFIRYNGE